MTQGTLDTQYTVHGNNKPRILVADDDHVVRDLFQRFLTSQGYEISTANDGVEAINAIENDSYDMLVLDLKMPKVSGMEVLEKIKVLKKDIIIIVITGYATMETAKKAMTTGCFDYITKPFSIDDVSVIIGKAFEAKRLAVEKKKLEEQIRTTEKLASLAEMGAGVAHEVNTVITSTKLFLEILKPKLSQKSDISSINLILEETERAEKLIERFLTFTKPNESEPVETDINKILRRSLQFLKYKLKKKKIQVIKNLNKKLPLVICDPSKMIEVFLNVYSNSIDAMNDGGELKVESRTENDNIVIEITDDGEGISPKNISKLYNPFFTTKPHGTGLGLSIVHRIIEEHNGLVEIRSEAGKGTSVRVELPIEGV